MPFDGNYICFPSGDSIAIGASGISTTYNSAVVNGTAAQTLAASTLHYAYVYNNAGTLVIDWSTTGPAWDATTGIRIKTSDATRVLVGMAYANGSSQFDDAATKRNVASWRNRRPRNMRGVFTTDRTTTATSLTEINSEIRTEFVCWGDAVHVSAVASTRVNDGDRYRYIAAAVDTTTLVTSHANSPEANERITLTSSDVANVAAGYHYLTVYGAVENTYTATIDSDYSGLSGLVTI